VFSLVAYFLAIAVVFRLRLVMTYDSARRLPIPIACIGVFYFLITFSNFVIGWSFNFVHKERALHPGEARESDGSLGSGLLLLVLDGLSDGSPG
jgi:hypothetical protein